jgi:PQQ-dependent dehydrogenase (methanol/ethanol family)
MAFLELVVHEKLFLSIVAGLLISVPVTAQQSDFVPVTDAMLENPDPADWLMWRRTQNHWGYSPLDQINRRNVDQLRLVWTRPINAGVQEGTPLVYDGVMYFPHPLDFTQAFNAATGDLIWEYRRSMPDDVGDYVLFPQTNRNLAIYGNYILDNGADNYAYALDARTGELAWETVIADYRLGGQASSGPIVGGGKVISGRSCAPRGGPMGCFIAAFDALTGEVEWRTYLIPRPGEPGYETWGDVPYEERRHVGGWMTPSYDPALNRVFVGTSVTSPAPKFMLDGNDLQYLYNNSTLSLDADTGEIVWYIQHVVDHWDLDHPFERLLVDTAIAPDPESVEWINPRVRPGEVRNVVTGVPGKTGLFYSIDRDTGQFLWARQTIEQNVIEAVNTESGEGIVNEEMLFTGVGQQLTVCPSLNGGKNYHASAYSPLSNAIYTPMHNTCMEATSNSEEWDPNDAYALDTRTILTPGMENAGRLEAISVETGETIWKIEQRAAMTSVMATGSGLLFSGDANGRFRALDQRTGEVLWEVNLGSHVTGYPATFAVDGRQYVAVSTGGSLNTMSLLGLAPELRAGTANSLYVFALPE